MPLFDWVWKKEDPLDQIQRIIVSLKPENDEDIEIVKKYLSILKHEGRSVNELKNKDDGTTLSLAITACKFNIGRLLLEAGANPHMNYFSDRGNIFHTYVAERSLPRLRFFLMFNPDYRNLPPFCRELKGYDSVDEFVDDWEKMKGKNTFSIKSIFYKTVDNSKRIKQLEAKVVTHLELNNKIEAIKCYQQLADIYDEEYELEKTLNYRDYSCYAEGTGADESLFTKMSTRYYRDKARYYYFQAEELCSSIENPSKEIMEMHIRLLQKTLKCNDLIKNIYPSEERAKQTRIFAEALAKLTVTLNPLDEDNKARYKPIFISAHNNTKVEIAKQKETKTKGECTQYNADADSQKKSLSNADTDNSGSIESDTILDTTPLLEPLTQSSLPGSDSWTSLDRVHSSDFGIHQRKRAGKSSSKNII